MAGFQLVGGLLLCVAFYHAAQMWTLDRDLQSYRAPDAARGWFVFVPARWQRRLYRPEAHPMIADAWKAMALMYAAGWAGALLMALGATSPDAPVRMVDRTPPAVECQRPVSEQSILRGGPRADGEQCR